MLIVQYLHVMFGATYFGLIVATFFYITNSLHYQNWALTSYAIKTSFFADVIILFITLEQFATAGILQKATGLTLQVPWVYIAYLAFSTVTVLWVISFCIRYLSYKSSQIKFKKSYIICNSLLILLLVMIFHDAIRQQTYLTFLHFG